MLGGKHLTGKGQAKVLWKDIYTLNLQIKSRYYEITYHYDAIGMLRKKIHLMSYVFED